MVETIKKKKKHSSKKHLSKDIIESEVESEVETNETNIDVESDDSILSPKPKHSKKKYEHKSSKSNKKNKKSKKKDKFDDEEFIENESHSKSRSKKRKHLEIEEENDDDEVEKKKNSKKKKDITKKKKKKSKKIVEEENESESVETDEKEKEEDIIDEKELTNEIRKLKMKSQNNNDNFSDIENEDSDIEEDSDTEELIQEENESVKEAFKINDYENMTNEEFNEKMKSLSKKRYREVYSNYALLFKPVLFQLSSRYLSDTNNLISMIQKFKNSKNSLYNRYNKFSVWPIPLSEQVSLPYSSYDVFTAEENNKIENIMFKKALENDIFFTDAMKEETKAYICEYWKKIHHQENFEYEELKKFEKKEQELLNNDNDNNTNNDTNDKSDDSDNQSIDFSLLSDEKVAIIQIKVLNRLNKIIDQMVTEQSFINRYRKNVSDFIGINNSGNILSQALIAGIPLPVIRNSLERMIDLTECDGGNISFYKKLDEFIKGLEKDRDKGKERVDDTSETDENNDSETDEDEVDSIKASKRKDNKKKKKEKEKDNMDDMNDMDDIDDMNDMNELKKLLGKYTLRKYGNALKSIKVKKNLEEIINKENVLNLYTFK